MECGVVTAGVQDQGREQGESLELTFVPGVPCASQPPPSGPVVQFWQRRAIRGTDARYGPAVVPEGRRSREKGNACSELTELVLGAKNFTMMLLLLLCRGGREFLNARLSPHFSPADRNHLMHLGARAQQQEAVATAPGTTERSGRQAGQGRGDLQWLPLLCVPKVPSFPRP